MLPCSVPYPQPGGTTGVASNNGMVPCLALLAWKLHDCFGQIQPLRYEELYLPCYSKEVWRTDANPLPPPFAPR